MNFTVGSDLIIATGTVATPGTWSSLGCLVSLTPNTITMGFEEIPPCLNAVDQTPVQRPTRVNYGNFAAVLEFDSTNYDTVKGFLVAGTAKAVGEILGDTGQALVAEVYFESLGIEQLTDQGRVQVAVSMKINKDFDMIAEPVVA